MKNLSIVIFPISQTLPRSLTLWKTFGNKNAWPPSIRSAKKKASIPRNSGSVIDCYVYTGKKPEKEPDIVGFIDKPLGILDREPTSNRIFDKVITFVTTFIKGIAA